MINGQGLFVFADGQQHQGLFENNQFIPK